MASRLQLSSSARVAGATTRRKAHFTKGQTMKTMIRAGVAAGALFAFLPAWGRETSAEDRLELRQPQLPLQLKVDDAARPAAPRYTLAPREASACEEQGSAAGEPARKRGDEKQEQRDAAREQFLNETWNTP